MVLWCPLLPGRVSNGRTLRRPFLECCGTIGCLKPPRARWLRSSGNARPLRRRKYSRPPSTTVAARFPKSLSDCATRSVVRSVKTGSTTPSCSIAVSHGVPARAPVRPNSRRPPRRARAASDRRPRRPRALPRLRDAVVRAAAASDVPDVPPRGVEARGGDEGAQRPERPHRRRRGGARGVRGRGVARAQEGAREVTRARARAGRANETCAPFATTPGASMARRSGPIGATTRARLDVEADIERKLPQIESNTSQLEPRAGHLAWLLVVSCAKLDGLFFAAATSIRVCWLCLVRKVDGLFFAADVTPRNPRNAPRCKP